MSHSGLVKVATGSEIQQMSATAIPATFFDKFDRKRCRQWWMKRGGGGAAAPLVSDFFSVSRLFPIKTRTVHYVE